MTPIEQRLSELAPDAETLRVALAILAAWPKDCPPGAVILLGSGELGMGVGTVARSFWVMTHGVGISVESWVGGRSVARYMPQGRLADVWLQKDLPRQVLSLTGEAERRGTL